MRVQGLRRKFYDVIPERGIRPPGREKDVRKSPEPIRAYDESTAKASVSRSCFNTNRMAGVKNLCKEVNLATQPNSTL